MFSVNLLLVNPTINDKIPKICVEIIHTDLGVVVCSEEERKTMGLGRVTRGHRVSVWEVREGKSFLREGGVSSANCGKDAPWDEG